MELEVNIPEMTKINKNNRVYATELPIGIKVPVTIGIPDTFDTPLVDMIGEAEIMEGNIAKIEIFKGKEKYITDLIAGDTVLVPRGAGKVTVDGHIKKISDYSLKDFNIIEASRSSYR